MKLKKSSSLMKFIIIIVVCVFSLFPTSLLDMINNYIFQVNSPNESYAVKVYKLNPYTIYSLYKIIEGEGYYFVVYDKCGREIYKPNFSFGMDEAVVYGGFKFYSENELMFPTNDGVDSLLLSDSRLCN